MNSLPDPAWNEALQARGIAERGARKSKHLSDQVDELERRVDHQTNLIQALTRMLVERLRIPEADLLKMVQELESSSIREGDSNAFTLE